MKATGRRQFRTPLSGGERRVSKEELKDFTGIKRFDNIGNIVKNTKYPLYVTEFCPEFVGLDKITYVVQIKWHNGIFTYFINFSFREDMLVLEPSELSYNGKLIDIYTYLKAYSFQTN